MSEQRINPDEWAVIHQDRAKRGVALNAIDEADWSAVQRHRAEKIDPNTTERECQFGVHLIMQMRHWLKLRHGYSCETMLRDWENILLAYLHDFRQDTRDRQSPGEKENRSSR